MSETVLVTGGTGYVAGWCIAELLRRGYPVRATVRDLAKEPAVREAVAAAHVGAAADQLTCVVADLRSDEGWAEAMAGCRYSASAGTSARRRRARCWVSRPGRVPPRSSIVRRIYLPDP